MILRIFIGRGVCLVLFCFVVLLVWCLLCFVFVCVFGLLCFSNENSAFNSCFIVSNFQLLTDNVSYSIGNAGKKSLNNVVVLFCFNSGTSNCGS